MKDRNDHLVNTQEVIAKRGPITVMSRYISDRHLEDFYDLEPKVLGSGMSGQVLLATSKADHRKAAVKSFKKRGLSTSSQSDLKSEVEIYLALDHPHVARLERVVETEDDIFLVMEYMAGGELFDRLVSKTHYNEENAASTTYQMLLAVAYLHAHKIVHRDLKLENFMYEAQDTDHLKLIDFGFAKFWNHGPKMSEACGSIDYVAPEVLGHSYTERADMWSLGIIVYMLLTGQAPFYGSGKELLKQIRAGSPNWANSRFNGLSDPAKKFVKALIVADPNMRMSADQALEHQWIKTKHMLKEVVLDKDIISSLRNYAHASSFRRAVLSMMAWSLCTEERKELRKLFLSMDTENHGTITHSKLKSILEDNFHISHQEAETLFKNLDTDNDNEIEYTEFLAAALQGRVKVHEDLLRKTFQRFDIDGTGKISLDNLKNVLGPQFEGHELRELIQEADTNNDGCVDYDEFLRYFQRKDGFDEGLADVEASEGPGTSAQRVHTSKSKDSISRKDLHTEKLGVLLDSLVAHAEKENAARAPAGKIPRVEKSLSRKDSARPQRSRL